MKRAFYILGIIIVPCSLLISCGNTEKKVAFETNDCKRPPLFYQKLGFNQQTSGISTNEKNIMGVVLVDFGSSPKKYFQDDTWKQAGWMGPISLDAQGNTFVGAAPKINILDNPPVKQNTLYKIDGITGKMIEFLDLPPLTKPTEQNPFGILGLAYMCTGNILYVSSVMGSDRTQENGVIYAIDLSSKKIIDQLEYVDALGLGISYISGYKKLYFGKARSSELYSVSLGQNGSFVGKPKHELSFSGYGPRGDDKIRKISFNRNHEMEVSLIEFNFNLIAPTEKQETKSTLIFDHSNDKWVFKQ